MARVSFKSVSPRGFTPRVGIAELRHKLRHKPGRHSAELFAPTLRSISNSRIFGSSRVPDQRQLLSCASLNCPVRPCPERRCTSYPEFSNQMFLNKIFTCTPKMGQPVFQPSMVHTKIQGVPRVRVPMCTIRPRSETISKMKILPEIARE